MTDPYSPWLTLERRLTRYMDRRFQQLEELVEAGTRFDQVATEALMLDLSALQAEVSRNTTVDASIKALCEQIADSIDGANQAQIDQIVSTLRNDNDSLAQFVVENTPAAGGGDGGTPTDGGDGTDVPDDGTGTDGGTDTGTPTDGGGVPGDTGTDTGEPVG